MPVDPAFVKEYISDTALLQQKVINISSNEHNKQTFQLVVSILSNIVNNPNDEKYRKIKKSNPKMAKLLQDIPDAWFILDHAGFQQNDEIIFLPSHADLVRVQESLHTINRCLAMQHSNERSFSVQEVNKEWTNLLNQGDQFKKEKNFQEAKKCYLQSAQLVEKEVVRNANFAVHCAHSHEQLADLCTNFLHDQGEGILHYREAVKFCDIEGSRPNMPKFKAQIMTLCYFGYATALTLMPQRDYNAILKYLGIAWYLCSFFNDGSVTQRKIGYMFIAIYSNLKQPDLVQYWTAEVAKLGPSNDNASHSGMVFMNRLMEVEQTINHANAKEVVKKAMLLYEDTKLINPEFAASVAGQIIYYHRLYASLELKDGIEWGMKALSILQPAYGEKHGVIRNVYLSLSDSYSRLGDVSLAQEYKQKMENSQRLLGMQ